MDSSLPELSVVVPFYNEAENLEELHERLKSSLDRLGCDYEVVLVDDGSRDAMPGMLDELQGATRTCRCST